MLGEEILVEIDTTLDKLINNAEAIQRTTTKLSEREISNFQKKQEKLLKHLTKLDGMLKNTKIKNKRSSTFKIQEKLLKFEKINEQFIVDISRQTGVIEFERTPQGELKGD